MERISRIEFYFGLATLASLRSTCMRAKVGAVAIIDHRPVAMGYNGALPGEAHCNSEICGENPCDNTVHAEANLIAFSAKKGIPLEGAELYITHSPCKDCSELIIQSGIKSIKYINQYRDTSGLDLLNRAGVNTIKCEPNDLRIIKGSAKDFLELIDRV